MIGGDDDRRPREGVEQGLPARRIGAFSGRDAGPSLVVVAAIHGNEPAGIHAARRVLDRLEAGEFEIRGDLTALAGNRQALAAGRRYLERDLNRVWTAGNLRRIGSRSRSGTESPGTPRELLEMEQLIEALAAARHRARGPLHLLDLHTMSAPGTPFVIIGDSLANRRFARPLTAPVILGLEEEVDGGLLEWANGRGWVTMAVEGGQHESPEAVDHLEAAILLAMGSVGLTEPARCPCWEWARRTLATAAKGKPRIVEVRQRHKVHPRDGFRMRAGFANFDWVPRSTLLAEDRDGPIRNETPAYLLLPLYQGQGEDGFFLARRVRPFWLVVARVLRWLRLGGLAPLLPGVRRHPKLPGTLIVNMRVAALYPLELFHLLGFRKLRRSGRLLLVSRRREPTFPGRV